MNVLDRGRRIDRNILTLSLAGLAVLFLAWFRTDDNRLAAFVVFALPPLLLAIGVQLRRNTARFWAGVLALLWFSHGVMTAWADTDVRLFALIEVVLALAVVFSANAAGLRAKFGRKR